MSTSEAHHLEFENLTGYEVPRLDYEKMLRIEAEAERTDLMLGVTWEECLHKAGVSIARWYLNGHHYDLSNLPAFIASYRQACVWAVLLRLQHDVDATFSGGTE